MSDSRLLSQPGDESFGYPEQPKGDDAPPQVHGKPADTVRRDTAESYTELHVSGACVPVYLCPLGSDVSRVRDEDVALYSPGGFATPSRMSPQLWTDAPAHDDYERVVNPPDLSVILGGPPDAAQYDSLVHERLREK